MFLSSIGFLLPHMLLYVPETVLLPGFGTIGTSLCVIFLRLFNITIKVVCLQGFSFYFSANKNVNIKFDIFSCFYRFAILHNTQPVLLYIFTFRQRSSKAATAASLSRSLYPLLCKLLYLFLE